MSYQITKLDLIPNGEIITCNSSQFDNGRVLPFEIYENKEAYNIPNDVRVELHCRKPDSNIVTIPSDTITDNIVTFITTTQLTACYGDNVCEIALYGADDYLIGSANFILEVEKSPTLGGINSTTEIHNLEEQIENITTEIIGENYYTKSETDTKLALKANAADVYTKSETDTKLALKANAADVYTKSETDTKLALKANAADVYTKSQVDNIIMDIMPDDTASGPIATFNTELAAPLVNVSCNIIATGGNGTPDNPNPINGFTEANITRCGVNLFDVSNINDTHGSNTLSINGDEITITWVNGATVFDTKNKQIFKAGNYIIKGFGTNINKVRAYFYKASDNTQLTNIYINTGTVITLTADFYIAIGGRYDDLDTATFTLQLEVGSTAHDYNPYNGQIYTIAFGQTVYGCVLDVTRGKLTVTHANIASYNGESINEPWLSSMDTYVPNTTPTTGAQVVYPLTTPFDIDLTPVQIRALVGTNNVFADINGNTTVKFKDTIQNYIDKKVSI